MWLLTFSIIEKIHSLPLAKATEDFINCTVTATLINDHCLKSVFAPATYHRLLGLCRTASGQKMNIFDLRLLASAEYILIKKSSSVSGLWWNIRFNLKLHYCALCLFTMGSFIRGIGTYSGQQQMRHPSL